MLPVCPPVDLPPLRHSGSLHVRPSSSSPSHPHPAMLFPPPGLTSPWRHAGASSSAPNYSLASSSAEKAPNCYETERNNPRPRENKPVTRLATSGSGEACVCVGSSDDTLLQIKASAGLRGNDQRQYYGCGCGNVRCSDIASGVWMCSGPVSKKESMLLFSHSHKICVRTGQSD